MNTIESEPMGLMDRLKSAGQVMVSGKLPNPLAEPPKDTSRAALVDELTKWVRGERKFWQPTYELMREEQAFAAGKQWPGDAMTGERNPYIGDIVQQLVNRLVASLYAQNPTPDAKRLEKLLFAVWDGSQESLRGAQQILAAAQTVASQMLGGVVPPVPQEIAATIEKAQGVVQDYERGMAEKALLDKIAETLRLLLKHQWKTHKPDFKVLMKQYVAQAVVSRVGFIQVAYRRDMETSPSEDSPATLADKLAAIQQKMRELETSDAQDSAEQREELRLMMQTVGQEMQSQGKGQVSYEGMVYQLVPADCVIIDRNCTCLWEFLGARRIARQTFMEAGAAERRWNISLRDTGAVLYDEKGEPTKQDEGGKAKTADGTDNQEKLRVCVWHIYDKDAQLCYVVCDGVKDFLEEPYEPDPGVERFWPLVPLTLNIQVVTRNDPDNDMTIYPRSHVRLVMPMQEDINVAGERLREHRTANKPRWLGVKSKFDEVDLAKISGPGNAHDVDMLNNLHEGEKITDYFQPRPTVQIDPKLYDPALSLQAANLATGLQPASLGAQAAGEKATGQAIAEGARISVDQSNIDGVNFAQSVIAHMSGEMLFQMMPEQTVKRIVGPGAVWPELSRADIQEEIYLEVEAGSSGRPNAAAETAKFKEIAPLAVPLMQQLGIPADVLLKKAFEILGLKIDLDELLAKAQPQLAVGAAMPAPGGVPGAGGPGAPLPPGQPAPNVMPPGGRPNTPPPLPPQQRQQMVRSAAL